MKSEVLSKFGQNLVEYVRDPMLTSLNSALEGKNRDVFSKYIVSMMDRGELVDNKAIRDLIVYVVDSTIESFLEMIDLSEGDMAISQDGIDLSTLTDGLQGEYSYKTGWPSQFGLKFYNTIKSEATKRR